MNIGSFCNKETFNSNIFLQIIISEVCVIMEFGLLVMHSIETKISLKKNVLRFQKFESLTINDCESENQFG